MVFFSPLGEPLLNPYTILNLEFGASDDDIGKAYKKLMLQLHPDKQPADQTEEEAEEVSRRFHDVMDAKSFLLDGEHLANRREYDARLVAAEKAKAAMEAKAAAEAKAQAQREAALAAQAKAQAQAQQKQSAPSTPPHTSSDKVKNHHSSDDTKPESSPSKSKPAAPSKSEDSKTDTTLKKPNLTKKQWGRVNRPTRRVQPDKEKPSSSSEPHKYDRKNSCSTTSEDSSSDDEGPQHHRGRSHTPRSKPKQKKSKATSDKPTASNNSKKTSDKNKVKEKSDDKAKPRSHAVSSKSTRKGSDHDKPTGGKKSASKKTSKTETTKQRSKSTSANQKLSASCHSFFDDDDKKNRSHSYERKNSYDGKTSSADKSPRKSSIDNTSSNKATPSPTATSNKTTSKASAPTSHFSAFQPAVDNLTKQYECPLTKEVMNEPMTDFEGNHYERDAIMKYLETHSTSPVTGNPLYPMFLTPNTALKERIKYTLKLKSTLDTLTFHENPVSPNDISQRHVVMEQQCQFKPLSLRNSVDMFIKELNTGSPNGIISRLDSSGNAPFTYNGLDFTLQVPEGLSSNVLVQTWFDHDRKAAGISARVVEWNRSLQEIGLGGKLTFRNIKGKFAFTLTREMKPEKFSKKELKHAIEYYLEMSIKLHNTINVSDQRKVDKVRLQDSCLAQQ